MSQQYAVGLDLGGTDIKAGLIATDGRIVAKLVRPTLPQREPDAVLAEMASLAVDVITQAGVAGSSVVGLGVGAPGPLSPSRGIIFKAANLPTFHDVAIRDQLARRTGLATILDNDGNAAAYGEFWAGAGRHVRNMVLFTLGTGLGAGVIVDGSLLRGHFENAAELGHTIVERNGRPCSCGQRGCLERYTSAGGIACRVIEATEQGSKSMLSGAPGGLENITGRDIARAVAEGDALATRIWDEACQYLALGCVNVQHTFNPAMIILGGGMSGAGDLLLHSVRKHLDRQRWSLVDDAPEVVLAELGNDAGMIGAAGLMFAAVRAPLSDNSRTIRDPQGADRS